MTTESNDNNISWEQLIESMNNAVAHPEETNWMIYRYLQHNYNTVGSVIARTLLSAYIKLRTDTPSLINSCMLGLAVKISGRYDDFRFPKFLEAWGYGSCLRSEDCSRQTGRGGRTYPALVERVDYALQSYLLHHPEARQGDSGSIVSMYATVMFEKVANGRRYLFVKLVAANGMALIAESRMFPCRTGEITGRLFDVLTRCSKSGNVRAADIVVSKYNVCDVFSVHTGFVEGIDDVHGHIHIYDASSHHYVADKKALEKCCPKPSVAKGDFVSFCPIIANGDHFKAAAVVGVMDKYRGREAFGVYTARITYLNHQEAYMRYVVESDTPDTSEGIMTREGFTSTAGMPADARLQLSVGQNVHFIMFLKRGKDGMKRNHVAEIF